ncbi:hypothetical protein PDJAM_G00136880 [Pangasius djambal]|uniref:Uncharacterized protein n=1 Tax=Pangasius djambal TaxID=1691987 RepID=A0ACC5ZED6_9TELE|nr:hypothetical protein [Pangasius djambal]
MLNDADPEEEDEQGAGRGDVVSSSKREVGETDEAEESDMETPSQPACKKTYPLRNRKVKRMFTYHTLGQPSIVDGLCDCGVSDEGCAALTSALRSNPSHLRELDLSWNELGDSGVKCLSAVLENSHCKLETLRLRGCGVSDEGCAALTSALRSNPSQLRELNLSWNKLRDSGVKRLSAVLQNRHCKLEALRLRNCGVSDEGCAALTSALRSNPSHLREVDLSVNKLRDSEKEQLLSLKLQDLRV